MDLLDLTEEQIDEVKNHLIEKEMVFESKRINGADVKFFETVTLLNTFLKIFLFFSMGIYIIINLTGIILSIIKNTSKNPIGSIVGLFIISFIVFAIFSNINTNKMKKENVLYIKGNNFIFNFNDGVVETPNLFYSLPYDSINRIEFIIHELRKGQIFGNVSFTFNVSGYDVNHIIRFTNLSIIENYIKNNFPALISILVVDGKGESGHKPIKSKKHLKYNLIALGILVPAILLIVIPNVLNYHSIALTLTAVILFITAILISLSGFLYTYHLAQGIFISGVFLIMGFIVPLFIIEISGKPVFEFILKDSEVLLPTVFGIIGLCLYAYIIIIILGKIKYKIKNRR